MEGKNGESLIGRTIDGRYEVVSILGSGSNSTVYKAMDKTLNFEVALKVLSPSASPDEKALERFRRGAEAASRLAHPNVVRIYAFNISEDGKPYLVMDCVQGVPLAQVLRNEEKLSEERCINIFTQICDALDYAHAKGVVHRNLKPSNIMLIAAPSDTFVVKGKTDLIKVVDFGIAKVFGEKETLQKLTKGGESMGTPQYMSPEQCTGQALDGRADIYAIGCMLYECLTGKTPHASGTAFEVMAKQVNEPFKPVSEVCPNLRFPAQMDQILSRILAKKQDDRYQSAGELRHDLALLLEAPLEVWNTRAVAAKDPEQFRQKAKPTSPVVQSKANYLKPLVVAAVVACIPISAVIAMALLDLQIPQLNTLKLAAQEKLLPPDDPRLLKTLNTMFEYYKSQNRIAEAWAFKAKIIKATEKPLDMNDPTDSGVNKMLMKHVRSQ